MVATWRDSAERHGSGTGILSTMPTHVAGDVLHWLVFGQVTITSPTAGWNELSPPGHTRTGGFGSNIVHRVYRKVAASSSETAPSATNGANDTWESIVTSYSGADTTTPEDGTPAFAGSSTTTPAPAVSPSTTDGLLVCATSKWTTSNSPATNNFTPPAGMTEREDFGNWDGFSLATEALSASGSTGTRSFTTSLVGVGISSSIVVRSASGGATHNADGTLAGTGTQTAAASSDKPVTASRTGTGTLTAAASSDKPVSATLAATGTLSATATVVSAALNATGTLTGTGTLTAAAASDKPVAATLAGTGTLTGSAASTKPATASLTGTGSLTASTATDKPVTATLAGTGTLSGTASTDKPASATLAGTGTLSATEVTDKPVQATLAGTGTLSATATVVTAGMNATGELAGTGALSASATVTKPVTASLVGTATSTASMTVVKPLTASLVATANLAAIAALGPQLEGTPGRMSLSTARAGMTTGATSAGMVLADDSTGHMTTTSA